MRPRHALIGIIVAAVWGSNFVAARLALTHISPLLLASLRFAIAALPALVLPRPRVPWPRLIAVSSTLFIGQFGLLFCGMQAGMPPGLASVLTQLQAVLTLVLATTLLHETPTPRQIAGVGIATAGLVVIATTVGHGGVTLAGLLLTLGAAASWGIGNVLLRGVGRTDMLALVVWLSVVPPLPLLALSLLMEGPAAIGRSFAGDAGSSLLALLYVALVATIGGYGLWGFLLRLYPASTVAPFALLVPVFGLIFSHLALGEQYGPTRLAGIAVVVLGLATAGLPLSWRLRRLHAPPAA